jgi:hypothetical protein
MADDKLLVKICPPCTGLGGFSISNNLTIADNFTFPKTALRENQYPAGK